MGTSTQSTGLPPECFLHPESDDEESFVVLCRSLPPDSLAMDSAIEAVEPIDASTVQESLKLTASAISQLSNSSSSFPPIPKEQDLVNALEVLNIQEAALPSTTTNSSVDLSPDEIQQKVDLLIEENMKLKETLHQNNLAMKKQYETLVLWQDDVMKVHQSHKEKFADTKKYIENLKVENSKLTEAVKSAQSAQAAAKEELLSLQAQKEEAAAKEKADYSFLKTGLEHLKEFELEAARKKISDLELQLEALQKEQNVSVKNAPLLENLQKELDATKQLNIQLTADSSKQLKESGALQKILLEEIKVLKEQLKEKVSTVITKETHENVQEQLMAAQMHITKLELLRNEDKETINAREESIAKFETLIKEMTDSIDTVTALRTQAELYKSDFEAERQAKEALKAEKEQITDDLRHMQRRNQQLLEEVERLRSGDFVHVGRPESQASAASAPQDSPPPITYACPMCMNRFRTLRLLEDHVEYCIQNTP